MRERWLRIVVCALGCIGPLAGQPGVTRFVGPTSSQPLALTANGAFLVSANPDNNSVTFFDLRLDRTFSVAGQPFVLFGGVQNVTSRRNFAGYEWNRRTNTEEFTEQQGIFPILGFEWRF